MEVAPSKRLIIKNCLFFKALSTFFEVFICYIDIWFLTYGIRAQGLGVSLLNLRHLGIFAITFFLQHFRRNGLEERKAKGLCFNCDNKYSKGHKCGEKKLFYIDCEEEEEEEQEPSQDENVEEISSEDLTPTISCNALAGISTPQTLKIKGYIKKKKVTILIDSGSTHNFIHYKLSPKYYGPYKVLQKIGTMAYKLELSASS
jgi:hypothetical protein